MILNPRKRTYLDPIHQDIVLNGKKDRAHALVMELIDSREFQRLRRIHQLGVSYFTFQGAESSRFTHSIGVMYIASLLVELLAEKTPQVMEYKSLILACALLHDIGHGPYSHVTEGIVGYDHEDWSCRIVSEDTEVNSILKKYDSALPEAIASVLKKTYKPKYISQMVSSQLDCDRFDYLLRDSYTTGTAYGLFALQRILSSMEVDEEKDYIVVSGEKGQTAVEDYLFARYSMYAQVYYHKKNLASRALLKKLVKRAVELGSKVCFMDEPTGKWLTGSKLSVSDYVLLDDVQMTYHIKRWLDDKDPVLADLAGRIVNRKLFKALRVPRDSKLTVAELKAEVSKIAKSAGFDPSYYVATEQSEIHSYDYYRPDAANPQTNIMIRLENGQVKELSQVSPAIEALVKANFESHWLIYPAEIKEKILPLIESCMVSAAAK